MTARQSKRNIEEIGHPIVNDFLEHFYNGDYKIGKDGLKIPCSDEHRQDNLSNMLSEALWNYSIARNNVKNTISDPSQNQKAWEGLMEWQSKCVTWITQARLAGIIIETESMTCKLKKSEQENQQLKIENMNLKKLNTELSHRLGNVLPSDPRRGKTETGSLGKP